MCQQFCGFQSCGRNPFNHNCDAIAKGGKAGDLAQAGTAHLESQSPLVPGEGVFARVDGAQEPRSCLPRGGGTTGDVGAAPIQVLEL